MNNHTDLPVVQKGGFAIYEKDKKVYLVNHKIGGLITMTFVLIILTPILMVAGGLFITLNLMAGLLILLASGLCGYFIYLGFTRLKRKKTASLEEQSIVAILDFEQNLFLDSQGNTIAPLNEVKFSKGFQITSSSPSIKASWGGGNSLAIFEFNGLVGGSAEFISYLKNNGVWNK